MSTSRRPTVADRLSSQRSGALIGRDHELAQLHALLDLTGDELPAVVYVHGPGGVGKTALLAEFARRAEDRDRATVRVDAIDVERSPDGIVRALRDAAGSAPDAELHDVLPPEAIVIIDRFEALASVQRWFWRHLVTRLPADVLLVVAGRAAHLQVIADEPELSAIVRSMPLRNLSPADAGRLLDSLLSAQGRAHRDTSDVLASSHGHPLALVIAADLYATGGDIAAGGAGLLRHPDASARLLSRFVDHAVSPDQRTALHVVGHARRVDREMLSKVLGRTVEQADELLDWLRDRPYAESHHDGLSVHDIVRDALDNDLRWRDHAAFADLHRRIRAVIIERITRSVGPAQQRAAQDLLYLHRGNPVSRQLYALDDLGTVTNRRATEADRGDVLTLFGTIEGAARRTAAADWLDCQPDACHVHVETAGTIVGATVLARLDTAADRDRVRDPVAEAAWRAVSRLRPPEPGEVVLHQFVVDGLTPGRIGPVADMIGVLSLSEWTRPNLGWVVLSSAHEQGWAPLWAYIGFEPLCRVDLDGEDGEDAEGCTVGLWARDFGRSPYPEWLDRMSAQELSESGDIAPPVVSPVALSREDFDVAVRSMLRELHQADRLALNPLSASRIVPDDHRDRVAEVLQMRVRQALTELTADQRSAPWARALDRTYIRSAATQEAAAEVLGLAFSTYRRHLGSGIDRLTEVLWSWELRGAPPLPDLGH